MNDEELIEDLYWQFDARRKGYGRWKNTPQSERDAFKAVYRIALKSHPKEEVA